MANTHSYATSIFAPALCNNRIHLSECLVVVVSKPGSACWNGQYLYSYLSYFGYKHGHRVLEGCWEIIDSHGLEPNAYRAGFLPLVAGSPATVRDRLRKGLTELHMGHLWSLLFWQHAERVDAVNTAFFVVHVLPI